MKRTLLALLLLLLAPVTRAAVVHVVLDDLIHPIADEFVGRALDEAAKTKADAVVLELRTPGGLETSMRGIVEKILKSPVPVIVWVGPSGARAASAGFFILQAADIAAMAPGTNTGAAHPVLLGEKLDDVMKMKMQNDSAAFIRSIAQRRGRNVAAAESGVREAKSFTEDEALSLKLIEAVAPNVAALLHWADGRTVKRFNGTTSVLRLAGKPIIPYDMSIKERVLSWIMDPNIAFILMSLGMLGIWAEFNHPGTILPGVVGAIAIVLGVFALNLLPTRFAAFALILVAFALFALEAKFVSYGVLGAGGVVCMIIGALLLVDGPIPEMRVSLVTALVVSVPIGVIAVFLMTLVLRAHKNPVVTGTNAMIGEIGIARTAVEGQGKVFVHGELWNAMAKSAIPEGARVRVRSVDGLRVLVEPVETTS
ncbi:MAG TPA: nodulation protein NfeD [Thermoanaerobaculia bacterium]|jgi:membrane-bound serine protease (ClpP class)|nr:nodulation protein NfeD [Thermoanaerobaculia bacterium]